MKMTKSVIINEIWNLLPVWAKKDENNPDNYKFHKNCKKWIDNCVIFDIDDFEENFVNGYTIKDSRKILKKVQKNA